MRHDCGEKRGGRYFVKSSPSGCGSRAVCAVLWGAKRTVGEKAPLRAQQPIARVSQRAPGDRAVMFNL